MAQLASLLVPIGELPKPDTSWVGNIAKSLAGGLDQASENRSFNTLADRIGGGAPTQQPGGFLSRLMGGQQAAPSTAPVAPVQRGPAQGSTFQPFIDTVKTKITNPYGLAAVAATGQAESGWSPQRANSTWSDPSQRGAAGTSGGVLSWRNERLQGLYDYAARKGETPGNISPQTQAEYFLQEDPNLVTALNNAKSPEEASAAMANAWRFAGYDQAGGEAARRRALAQNYYAQNFRDMPAAAPNEVASLDPSIGIPMPGAAGQMRASDPGPAAAPAPTAAYVDPQVTTDYRQPAPQPAAQPASAPVQVADSGPGILAPGVTPVQRGGVDPALIQFMLRDPNLRQAGLQLWQQNATGKTAEPWQFVTLPDGTLARANQQTGEVQRIGQFAKPQEPISVSEGETLLDPVTKQPIYEGKSKDPASWNEYQKAKGNGFAGSYADWEKVKVPGTSVNVNTGEGDKFYEKLDQKNAENFATIGEQGITARANIGQVDRLESLLANTPQGAQGAIKQWLGDIGVSTEGLDNIQATRALIEKMVPEQRAPGSGTMSDGDIAMFRNSLPRVINQPGGNALIIQTLRAINDYQMKQGEIADAVSDRAITPAEGRKRLRELANPLSGYRDAVKGFTEAPKNSGISRPKTEAEFNSLPSGALYIDPDDNKTYRKP